MRSNYKVASVFLKCEINNIAINRRDEIMSLHKKLMHICDNRDLSSYLDMLHDDFTVVFHKSGNSFSKEEWSSMVAGMFENEKFVFESSRCVYLSLIHI